MHCTAAMWGTAKVQYEQQCDAEQEGTALMECTAKVACITEQPYQP